MLLHIMQVSLKVKQDAIKSKQDAIKSKQDAIKSIQDNRIRKFQLQVIFSLWISKSKKETEKQKRLQRAGTKPMATGPRSRPKRQDVSHSDHLAGLKE